jgi:hypothetical protein
MTGFAYNPDTAVLPTCSMASTCEPTAASTRERSSVKREGHRGSYGTTNTGSTIKLPFPVRLSGFDSTYPAPAHHPPYNNPEVQGRLASGRSRMKAIRVHEYGGPEVLSYEDVPDPEPGPGQARVRLAASGSTS